MGRYMLRIAAMKVFLSIIVLYLVLMFALWFHRVLTGYKWCVVREGDGAIVETFTSDYFSNPEELERYICRHPFPVTVHVYTRISHKLRHVMHYDNGKRNGIFMSWFPGGGLSEVYRYDAGIREGIEIIYYPNGRIWYICSYKGGKQDGLAMGWHENGEKHYRRTFKDGKIIGRCERWDEEGNKIFDALYDENENITSSYETVCGR